MSLAQPFRDILIREFESRVEKNSSYSLRAFSRDVGLSPSQISLVFSGKKGLSRRSALQISLKLGLGTRESHILVSSAVASSSRSKKLKAEAKEQLNKLLARQMKSRKYKEQEISIAQHWHHYALLELLELENFRQDTQWISRKLGVSPVAVKVLLLDLTKLGWIRLVSGKYVATHEQSETSYDKSSSAIRHLHSSFMKKAEQSLFADSVDEREFLNMTLAFPRKDMAKAKEYIRRFQQEFAEQFYDPNEKKDSVFQLSVQFFRLDKKEGTHD